MDNGLLKLWTSHQSDVRPGKLENIIAASDTQYEETFALVRMQGHGTDLWVKFIQIQIHGPYGCHHLVQELYAGLKSWVIFCPGILASDSDHENETGVITNDWILRCTGSLVVGGSSKKSHLFDDPAFHKAPGIPSLSLVTSLMVQFRVRCAHCNDHSGNMLRWFGQVSVWWCDLFYVLYDSILFQPNVRISRKIASLSVENMSWEQSSGIWMETELTFTREKIYFNYQDIFINLSSILDKPLFSGRSEATFRGKFKLKYQLTKIKRHVNKYCSKSKKPSIFCFWVKGIIFNGLLCQNNINISLGCLPKVGRGENLSSHLFNIFKLTFKIISFKAVWEWFELNYHFVLWTRFLTQQEVDHFPAWLSASILRRTAVKMKSGQEWIKVGNYKVGAAPCPQRLFSCNYQLTIAAASLCWEWSRSED